MGQRKMFTNPIKVQEKEDHNDLASDWPLAFCGYDEETGKHYAVTTDHVKGSDLDPVTPRQWATLFAQAPKMYYFIRENAGRLGPEKMKEAMEIIEPIEEVKEDWQK